MTEKVGKEILEEIKDKIGSDYYDKLWEELNLLYNLVPELEKTTIDIGDPENGDSETYVDTNGKVLISRHMDLTLWYIKTYLKEREHK